MSSPSRPSIYEGQGSSTWLGSRVIVVLVGLYALAGCADDEERPAESTRLTATASPVAADLIPEDEIVEDPLHLALARANPEFAGFFYDAQGRMEVAVTEAARFGSIRDEVRAALPTQVTDGLNFTQRVFPYSFLELARYRTALSRQIGGIKGVISLSVKESRNRVMVGVVQTERRAKSEVLALAASLGIPEEVILFSEASAYPDDQVSLTQSPSNNKLQAGYQVIPAGGGTCTLGFTAKRKDNGDDVMVTASHCSDRMADPDFGAIGQPSTSPSLGNEIRDPNRWGCYGISLCRHSDASLYSVNSTRAIDFGKIARTIDSTNCENCSGASLTVDAGTPTLTITGRQNYSIENETLHKIGKTTGWTYGTVEDTCGDYWSSGFKWKLCADRVDYLSQGGDSGAPVFSVTSGTNVKFRGIHVQSYWLPNGWDGVMVRISQIEKDLGGLSVYDPGPPTVSISGPTSVQTGLLCTWTANVNNGLENFSYNWSGLWSGSTDNLTKVATSSGWLTVLVTDILGRTHTTQIYITVSPSGPTPPGCTE